MVTVTNRADLRLPGSPTARFSGEEHGSGVSFFWVATPAEGGTEPHHHPYTETWVVLAGRGLIRAGGDDLEVQAGAVVTVAAGEIHSFRSLGPQPLEMICIHASSRIIQHAVTAPADAP